MKTRSRASMNPEPPWRFIFLTLPNYSLIAVSSAVEALRMANRVTKQNVYAWTIASLDGSAQTASNGLAMSPSEAIDGRATADIVFVCGGVDVERAVCNNRVLARRSRMSR